MDKEVFFFLAKQAALIEGPCADIKQFLSSHINFLWVFLQIPRSKNGTIGKKWEKEKNYLAEEISPEKYMWVKYILDSHVSIANCQPFKLYEESREQNSIVKGAELC